MKNYQFVPHDAWIHSASLWQPTGLRCLSIRWPSRGSYTYDIRLYWMKVTIFAVTSQQLRIAERRLKLKWQNPFFWKIFPGDCVETWWQKRQIFRIAWLSIYGIKPSVHCHAKIYFFENFAILAQVRQSRLFRSCFSRWAIQNLHSIRYQSRRVGNENPRKWMVSGEMGRQKCFQNSENQSKAVELGLI